MKRRLKRRLEKEVIMMKLGMCLDLKVCWAKKNYKNWLVSVIFLIYTIVKL